MYQKDFIRNNSKKNVIYLFIIHKWVHGFNKRFDYRINTKHGETIVARDSLYVKTHMIEIHW